MFVVAKNKGKNYFKILSMAFKEILRNILWILFLAFMSMVFFAWYSAMTSGNKVKATIMLRYEQAYEGLNPNGTRFNINELLSDEVLQTTISLAGLQDELTTDDLLSSIAVKASGSQEPENMYIATEYTIELNNRFLPRRITAYNMMNLLMETYKQYFMKNYGSNDSALNIDWADTADWEYIEFADIMNVKVNNLITYVDNLRSESGMYQYHSAGESFRSLSESIANFRDIYLNKYTSYVTNNHLFRNPAAYRDKLVYRRFLKNQSLSANQEIYRIYQDALKMYDETMITFMMVPMFDTANGLYMARTGIGMDDLTIGAQEYAEKIENDQKQILAFDASIENTYTPETSQEKYAYADDMISEIEDHLNSIILRIQAVKKEYEEYRFKSSITYVINQPGLMSTYNVKGTVVAGFVVVILSSMYYMIRTIRKESKS